MGVGGISLLAAACCLSKSCYSSCPPSCRDAPNRLPALPPLHT